jgi:hypothetical protein
MLDGLKVADIVAPLIVALIIWLITVQKSARKEIVDSVKELGGKVHETNGRVIKLETGIADHIKHDDERFDESRADRKDLWERLNNTVERRHS